MVSPVRFYDHLSGEENAVYVPAYRQTLAAPDTKTYWVEDAACNTSPAELFEPTFDLGSRVDNIRVSNERYEQAKEVCATCPVFHMCYTKAREADFFYTTRAGVKPTQLVEYEEQGRLNYMSRIKSDKCPRGHSNWKIWGKKQKRRKCVDCSNMGTEGRAEWDATNGIL